jgi:hypothetical protein
MGRNRARSPHPPARNGGVKRAACLRVVTGGAMGGSSSGGEGPGVHGARAGQRRTRRPHSAVPGDPGTAHAPPAPPARRARGCQARLGRRVIVKQFTAKTTAISSKRVGGPTTLSEVGVVRAGAAGDVAHVPLAVGSALGGAAPHPRRGRVHRPGQSAGRGARAPRPAGVALRCRGAAFPARASPRLDSVGTR